MKAMRRLFKLSVYLFRRLRFSLIIPDFVRSPTTLQYEFVKITKEACLFSDEMWQEQSLVRSQRNQRDCQCQL